MRRVEYVDANTGAVLFVDYVEDVAYPPTGSSAMTAHDRMTPKMLDDLREGWASGRLTVCPYCRYPLSPLT